jgi:hypothetical protein
MNNLLDAMIAAKLAVGGGSGGGGDVTPESIVTATGQMTDAQKAATIQNIGAVSASEFIPTVILLSVDGGAVELDLSGIGLTVQQFFEAYIDGKRFYFVIAEINNGVIQLTPTYFDEITARLVFTGYDNGSLYVAELLAEGEYVLSGALRIIQLEDTVVNVSGTTPTITPADNTVYNCGELTSLTISNPPATGKYSIIFFSGATPTTTVGIENFVAEANKRYKITVEDNYATYDSWPYTPT